MAGKEPKPTAVRVKNLFTDYESKGFFRIGVLPIAVFDGVTFEFVVDPQPTPPVYVAVAEIRELLLNLLFNAVDLVLGRHLFRFRG